MRNLLTALDMEELYATQPGQTFVTSLSQDTAPAEKYGNQSLFSRYRTDKTCTKKTDLMTYSTHDGHQLREWREEDKKSYFNPDFLRRVWFIGGVKSQAEIQTPEEFFLRPALFEDKFPGERNISLPPELRARVDAQEKAGQLVFTEEVTTR